MGQWNHSSDSSFEPTGRRGPRLIVGYALVLGLVFSFLFVVRLPIGGSIAILGRWILGPVVVTVSDLYLLIIATGLIACHREIVVCRSLALVGVVGVVATGFASMVVNLGPDTSAMIELLQWVEMGSLMVLVTWLLDTEAEIWGILRALTYVAALKATWTLAYFTAFGYTDRRFDSVLEGVGVVILLGIIVVDVADVKRLLLFALCCSSVLISLSRKVWVSIFVASVFVSVMYAVSDLPQGSERTADRFSLVGVGIIVVAIGAILSPVVVSRMSTLLSLIPFVGGVDQFERLFVYETGLKMAIHNPVLGVGPDNWHAAKPRYITEDLTRYEQRTNNDVGTHNLVIKVLSEHGFVGLWFFLLIFVEPVRTCYNSVKTSGRSVHLALPLGGLLVFILTVSSLKGAGFLTRGLLFLTVGLFLVLATSTSTERSLAIDQ